ncbi:MAG: helix-turn-helix domain-containing protein [Candidatus Woesearchaeota archaeon]
MLVQQDFIRKIKDFGLNTYEAKIWTALLSRGVSTAGELSDIANVPRSRSYDVLESLEKKGFIIMKIDKPIKYIAIPPEEVISRVKKKVRENAERQEKMLDDIKTTGLIEELTILHNKGIDIIDPTEISGALKGRENLYNQIDMMIKNSNKSIILMTSSEGLVRKFDYFKKQLNKAKDRGVSIKIAAPITKNSQKIINELKELAEIRHSTNKSRFILVDNKHLMFMFMDDKDVHPTYDAGVWVQSEFFANTINNMFLSIWKDMKPAEQIIKLFI